MAPPKSYQTIDDDLTESSPGNSPSLSLSVL